jgi:hypothetical protein
VSLSITGGSFNMAGVGGAAISPGPGQPIVAGIYQGTGVPGDSLTSFSFFGGPVNTFTAASAPGGVPGGPVPTGSVDDVAGTISMDLSSFIAFWNGTFFNQGNAASGSYNAVTGAYDLSWSRLIVGGPFSGFTGAWTINGIATVAAAPVVPLPAGVWLLGVGLAGVLGLARRRGEEEVVEA